MGASGRWVLGACVLGCCGTVWAVVMSQPRAPLSGARTGPPAAAIRARGGRYIMRAAVTVCAQGPCTAARQPARPAGAEAATAVHVRGQHALTQVVGATTPPRSARYCAPDTRTNARRCAQCAAFPGRPPRAERGERWGAVSGEGAVCCLLSQQSRSSCAAPSAFPARTTASHALLDVQVSGAGRGASGQVWSVPPPTARPRAPGRRGRGPCACAAAAALALAIDSSPINLLASHPGLSAFDACPVADQPPIAEQRSSASQLSVARP